MSSNLLNFGFRKPSEAEIKRRNEEQALAYDPIEVERERAVKKEVQKLEAEEEAAQKAELARFLSMKRQQRFREHERFNKNMHHRSVIIIIICHLPFFGFYRSAIQCALFVF
jgi:hypothetical protein